MALSGSEWYTLLVVDVVPFEACFRYSHCVGDAINEET